MDGLERSCSYKEQDVLDLSTNIPESILLILAGSKLNQLLFLHSIKLTNELNSISLFILFLENLITIEKVLKTSKIDLISYGLTEEEADMVKAAVSVNVPCTTFLSG